MTFPCKLVQHICCAHSQPTFSRFQLCCPPLSAFGGTELFVWVVIGMNIEHSYNHLITLIRDCVSVSIFYVCILNIVFYVSSYPEPIVDPYYVLWIESFMQCAQLCVCDHTVEAIFQALGQQTRLISIQKFITVTVNAKCGIGHVIHVGYILKDSRDNLTLHMGYLHYLCILSIDLIMNNHNQIIPINVIHLILEELMLVSSVFICIYYHIIIFRLLCPPMQFD